RDCYGCYGPAENANTDALSAQFRRQGRTPQEIAWRFQSVNNQAPVFLTAADKAGAQRDA
ncbi:MAG TPA: sulfhydrogenase subunit delta, partial [Thiobacillus sp.]